MSDSSAARHWPKASASIARRLKVLGGEGFEQPCRHGLPFRSGAVRASESVQVIVRVRDLSTTASMPKADWPTGSFETVVGQPLAR